MSPKGDARRIYRRGTAAAITNNDPVEKAATNRAEVIMRDLDSTVRPRKRQTGFRRLFAVISSGKSFVRSNVLSPDLSWLHFGNRRLKPGLELNECYTS